MNRSTRDRRRILADRRRAHQDARRPHSANGWLRLAGTEDPAVANGIRTAAKKQHLGRPARLFKRTDTGAKCWRRPVRGTRYSRREALVALSAYRPRVERCKAAKTAAVAYLTGVAA